MEDSLAVPHTDADFPLAGSPSQLPGEMKACPHRHLHRVFTVALFTPAKMWEWPVPSVDE